MKRMTPPCVLFAAVALLAAACGSSAEVQTAPDDNGDGTSEPGLSATVDGLVNCSDIAQIPTTKQGALGGRSNPDDRVMGVIYTYAQENQDVFAGIWIDRENDGTIAIAFTDDPARHTEALNARGPLETDEVGVEPPPPITDARPLGERDDIVFEVVQGTISEVALRSLQDEIGEAVLTIEGAGLDGWSSSPLDGTVSLDLVDPTDDALARIEELVSGKPVCVFVSRTPPAPTGLLDIISANGDPVGLPQGLGEVEWVLDPSFAPPGPDDVDLHVLVTERGCASGRPMGDRLQGPQVIETDDSVRIAFAVTLQAGGQDCPGNPATPVTVPLVEPLGNRNIVDGLNPARQPVMGEGFDDQVPDETVEPTEEPLIGQELDGDGWRLVSSTGFIDQWSRR